jgi:quinol-cytochrome oxidoreductase complex cytochrome b subunit
MAENNEELTFKRFVEWIKQALQKAIFSTINWILPVRAVNPLRILGLLTFVCFGILGLTGILLQVYYQPDFTNSYNSVAMITNEVPYGFEIRNIHYWASHFMVLLAIAHLFYIFFTRKYKQQKELLWVMGMLMGLVTVAEAYTGYVLIMNTRAMLAVNIGSGIMGSISPALSNLMVGYSYTDLVLRLYTLHCVALPAIIVLLVPFHFPKTLRIDFPSIIGVTGLILFAGGLVQSELGMKFIPGEQYGITIPEWYLTGVYALLRTGTEVFIAGVLIPFLLIFVLMIIPFYDRESRSKILNRRFYVVLGITALIHIILVTIWGYRGGNLLNPIASETDLAINPFLFFGSLLAIFILTLAVIKFWYYVRSREVPRKISLEKSRKRVLSPNLALVIMICIVIVQIIVSIHALYIQPQGIRELAMIESGLVIIGFAVATHIYRAAKTISP